MKKLYTDGTCGGKCAQAIEQAHGISVEVVRHPGNRSTGNRKDAQRRLWPEIVAKDFVVQAKCRAVERTLAWNDRACRLVAHHDVDTLSDQAVEQPHVHQVAFGH